MKNIREPSFIPSGAKSYRCLKIKVKRDWSIYTACSKFFKESECIHACLEVSLPHNIEEWTHQNHPTLVTETEDKKLDYEDSLMLPLIYLDYSNDEEDYTPPIQPRALYGNIREKPSMEPTLESVPPSKKSAIEPTS